MEAVAKEVFEAGAEAAGQVTPQTVQVGVRGLS